MVDAPLCQPVLHTCQGCGKESDSTLNCPTCQKLGLPQAYFCGQACFKENWNKHKQVHKAKKDEIRASIADPALAKFVGYNFTGELRPHEVTTQKKAPKHIKKPDYAVDGLPVSEMKRGRCHTITPISHDKVEALREACVIGRQALDLGHTMCKPGVTCAEIDDAVHDFIISKNCYPSPLNYHHFPKSLCTSVNEVICHGIPDKRALVEGDIVNLDVTVFHKGVHADLNETYAVGKVDDDSIRLMKGAHEALWTAIKKCKPGVMYRDLGQHIEAKAKEHKLSVVRTYCGHGIGELFHTSPNVPHYAKNKAVGSMKPGHVFTIEPMLNLGKSQDKTWPDDWTAVTADGSRSAQYEHTLLITETGVEVLTARLEDSLPLDYDNSYEENVIVHPELKDKAVKNGYARQN